MWDCSGLCVSFVALGGTSCRRRRFSLCALVTTTPLPLVPGGMVEVSLSAMGVGGFEFLEETQGSVREEEEAEKTSDEEDPGEEEQEQEQDEEAEENAEGEEEGGGRGGG